MQKFRFTQRIKCVIKGLFRLFVLEVFQKAFKLL